MFALFPYLQYLLLLYSIFPSLIIIRPISYAQFQYLSNFDYRPRPSRLVINGIRKLRPVKSAEPFDIQMKKSSRKINITNFGRSQEQLRNTIRQYHPQRSKSFTPFAGNEMNYAIPKAVSPFLQTSNNNEREEKPRSVKPELRSTTTELMTRQTTQPTSLSITLPMTDTDGAQQTRRQARWRKLGPPAVKSLTNPLRGRNWHRVVLAKSSNYPLHFLNRMKRILKNFRQQKQSKRTNTDKVEKRPRVGGILLSNSEKKSEFFNNKVGEWPIKIVEPTTTRAPTNAVVETTVSVTDFSTEEPTTTGTTSTTVTPTVVIPKTTSTTTASSASSVFNSKSNDFDRVTTAEPKSLPSSTETNDYHFRKITPAKKFKFAQKYRRQPRLKIRKPNDKGFLRGNQTSSGRSPITLPQLEPLNFENEAGQTNLHNGANDFSSDSTGIRFDNKNTESSWNGFSESTGFDKFDKVTEFTTKSDMVESNSGEFGSGTFPTDDFDLSAFGGGKPPPVDFSKADGISVFGSGDLGSTTDDRRSHFEAEQMETEKTVSSTKRTATTPSGAELNEQSEIDSASVSKNSGLIPASPPKGFDGDFGTGKRPILGGVFHGRQPESRNSDSEINESIFTGDSALVPNRAGPTGDGLGPPIPSGAAIPPPVPAVGIGGAAAGILPPLSDRHTRTENPPTTIKPSALLNFLTKADVGFNQAINHFEQGTPIESAAIDILEVALGSEKLDSQAKLLGHIDRTFGLDNLQRLQRWANTGGALDAIKEQIVKFVKNYTVPDNLFPTVPPQFQYLFAPGRKR